MIVLTSDFQQAIKANATKLHHISHALQHAQPHNAAAVEHYQQELMTTMYREVVGEHSHVLSCLNLECWLRLAHSALYEHDDRVTFMAIHHAFLVAMRDKTIANSTLHVSQEVACIIAECNYGYAAINANQEIIGIQVAAQADDKHVAKPHDLEHVLSGFTCQCHQYGCQYLHHENKKVSVLQTLNLLAHLPEPHPIADAMCVMDLRKENYDLKLLELYQEQQGKGRLADLVRKIAEGVFNTTQTADTDALLVTANKFIKPAKPVKDDKHDAKKADGLANTLKQLGFGGP